MQKSIHSFFGKLLLQTAVTRSCHLNRRLVAVPAHSLSTRLDFMSVGASASKTPESATPSKKRALKAAAKDEETTTPKKRIKVSLPLSLIETLARSQAPPH